METLYQMIGSFKITLLDGNALSSYLLLSRGEITARHIHAFFMLYYSRSSHVEPC